MAPYSRTEYGLKYAEFSLTNSLKKLCFTSGRPFLSSKKNKETILLLHPCPLWSGSHSEPRGILSCLRLLSNLLWLETHSNGGPEPKRRGSLRFLPPLEVRPSSIAPFPAESRGAPPPPQEPSPLRGTLGSSLRSPAEGEGPSGGGPLGRWSRGRRCPPHRAHFFRPPLLCPSGSQPPPAPDRPRAPLSC